VVVVVVAIGSLSCGLVVVAVDPVGSCRRIADAGHVQTRNEQVGDDMEERKPEASHTEVGYAVVVAVVVGCAAVGMEYVAIAVHTQGGQVEAGGQLKQNAYDENHIVDDERSAEEDLCICCNHRSDYHGGLWICLCLDDTNRCCQNENDLCHRCGRGYYHFSQENDLCSDCQADDCGRCSDCPEISRQELGLV
jgi:hypothetical protein